MMAREVTADGSASSTAAERRRAVVAALAFATVWLAVHGIVGAWAPLGGDDWRHARWAATHASGWWPAHASLGEACAYALVRLASLHALVSPVLGLALVVGVFALAMRRLPDPRRGLDVLGVALASAMLWIALPRAGAMWFHRSYAAAQIWGGAVAVWLAVPYRLGWRGPKSRLRACVCGALAFLVGLLATTSTRAFAVALVCGLVLATLRTRREQRRAWQWAGIAGALLGTGSSIVRAPWAEVGRVFTRLEPTLAALAPLLRAGVVLLAVVGLAVLLRRRRDDAGAPDAGRSLEAVVAWLGLGVVAQLGPRGNDAVWLPAALALVVAVLPWALWLAHARVARSVAIGVVVLLHVVVWRRALVTYAAIRDEAAVRLAVIARTPVGEIARVAPRRQIVGDAWWIGEDWLDAAPREATAREVWGLADLELVPPPRQLERSAALELVLEVEQVTEAQLEAAGPPKRWSRELGVARRQFEALVARLRGVAGPDIVARLRVTNIAGPGTTAEMSSQQSGAIPRRRPIYAAWVEGPRPSPPPTTHGAPDATSQVRIAVAPTLPSEVWLVTGERAQRLSCTGGSCRARLLQAVRTVTLLCDAQRCLAADAWVPRF